MLTYVTAGESHGPQLTAVLTGIPAGLPISLDKINYQLARRQTGYGRGGRMKIESDQAQILSGVRHGFTLGSPVTLVITNKDWPNWDKIMHPIEPISLDLNLKEKRLAEQTRTPRPGHADLSGGIKHNHHDLRNVLERASARETAARVAVGAVTRQLLEQFDVKLASHVLRIGTVLLETDYDPNDLDSIKDKSELSEVRCIDPTTETKMIEEIKAAQKAKDSLGGVVEVLISGLPAGLGGYAQSSDRLDGKLAGAMMSIQSVKAVEVGLGFEASQLHGSEVHDEIFFDPKGDPRRKNFYRRTNRAGGLEGGMTTGETVVLHVGCKPISTLNRPLETVDVLSKQPAQAMVERTDNCVVPALGVVCEAVSALVLADCFLDKYGSDNYEETRRNYQAWLDWEY